MDSERDKAMGEVIRIDEGRIKDHLGEMVRGTVEEALNAMLDSEADHLCGAGRYERREAGKPHKVIITAVARKLVTIANALCKNRQKWVARAP